MARKRYSDEDALKLLREIDVHLIFCLLLRAPARAVWPLFRPLAQLSLQQPWDAS